MNIPVRPVTVEGHSTAAAFRYFFSGLNSDAATMIVEQTTQSMAMQPAQTQKLEKQNLRASSISESPFGFGCKNHIFHVNYVKRNSVGI